jgi:hypothetical protein
MALPVFCQATPTTTSFPTVVDAGKVQVAEAEFDEA